jgi:hypothetical protein
MKNYVTEEIINRYDVSTYVALEIQKIMERSGVDFAELTDTEFLRCMNDSFHIYLQENETY